MPTETQIKEHVLGVLEGFSGVPTASIKDEDKLKENLNLDHPAHVFLAMALRGYVRYHNPSETITVGEIEKSGFTAKDLVDLIRKKVLG